MANERCRRAGPPLDGWEDPPPLWPALLVAASLTALALWASLEAALWLARRVP